MLLNKRFLALLIVNSTISATAAFGASFDCTKSLTNIEQEICWSEELSALDEMLSYAYGERLKKPEWWSLDELKKSQVDWLSKRELCAGAANYGTEECIRNAYLDRLERLSLNVMKFETQSQHRSFIIEGMPVDGTCSDGQELSEWGELCGECARRSMVKRRYYRWSNGFQHGLRRK